MKKYFIEPSIFWQSTAATPVRHLSGTVTIHPSRIIIRTGGLFTTKKSLLEQIPAGLNINPAWSTSSTLLSGQYLRVSCRYGPHNGFLHTLLYG
jgi:hypothetical protein